ncbi:MAG TPA: phage holin family protein [Nocardioides sp.]|uniref:phage holin family protein n=1 Tax=Nocardioides sp. TaxID=35761 RepID=UPI002F42F537
MAQQPVQDTDPTIGRLVSDASRDLSSLIRSEIRLAKSEIQISVKAGGMGIALLAVGAFFGLMALIMLSIAVAFFIHWNGRGLSLHWAFLIVFGFYLLVAGLLALIGVRKIKKVRAPQKAIAQANETKQILKRD